MNSRVIEHKGNKQIDFTISENHAGSFRLLKQGIWLYFLLLIFEGALRKWILPGLATPLLIVRDPLAIWLIFYCWHKRLFTINPYIIIMGLVTFIGLHTALLFGHGSLQVAVYGARTFLLHFPLMYVIGRIFDTSDILKLGKLTLYISVPMVCLIALQFYSPQEAWVNVGVGGEGSAGFGGALGYFRPPGTFSFTNGNSLFFGFVASFVFYFWLNPTHINRILLIAATISLLVSIPLSISRTLFFQVGVVLMFSLIAVSGSSKYMIRMLLTAFAGIIVIYFLNETSFFQTATKVFTHRFENATESEGGLEGVLLDRYLGGMIEALFGENEIPFWGYGIGMGTNVGSMLLVGERTFLVAEGEWGRTIGELGPLLGILIILIRLGFSIQITIKGLQLLAKGNILPWMLLSFGLLIIPQGQWAQPTSLGFSTLIGGLILASLRDTSTNNQNI